MPVGVVLVSTKRYELKTLPEAYVVVRRMNYGEELDRTGMATKFKMGAAGEGSKDAFQGELDINTKEVALWDFSNLIVDHNITDENEKILNFKDPNSVKKLASNIGKEIGECIDAWQTDVVKDTTEVKNS